LTDLKSRANTPDERIGANVSKRAATLTFKMASPARSPPRRKDCEIGRGHSENCRIVGEKLPPTAERSAVKMPCLLVILLVAFPRIALVLIFFSSNYLQHAYHGLIVPLLGFLFLPLTTLVYAWIVNTHQAVAGINLVILVVAVLIDLGGLGSGEHHRRSRWS
jgi:hypothetical protein